MDIHRCRFVDYTPHTVTSSAFSHASDTSGMAPAGLRLAVGRSNGDIEIWNPRYNWVHEMTLPGAKGRAVEGLVWAHADGDVPRLFSIGGSTYITEWDLKTGRPKANLNCNTGVIWCIDSNAAGTKLAVGCDDGSVVVVDISGGSGVMDFEYICQRQDQRVLGLRWYGNERVLGGCADGKVHCWAAEGDNKGSIVGSLKVDKSKTEATLVWSVECLPARGQFVTGDSTGSVKFWDAENFSLVQSFAVHDADVLSLARDASGDKVFSAGIDRKIHQFSWLESTAKKSTKWIHNFNRLLHSNDVRTLALFESKAYNFLVSGGVERSIIVQSVENFSMGPYKKILLDQQVSNLAVCPQSHLIALFQDQTVKIWRLDDGHKLVAKLTMAEEDNITSVSIGENGDNESFLLAVATINSVKVFRLTDAGSKLKVQKIRDPDFDAVVSGAKSVRVYSGNKILVQTPEDELYKFVVGEKIELEDELESVAEPGNALRAGFDHFNAIRRIAMSPDGSLLAVSRFNSSVELLPMDGSEGHTLATISNTVHLMEFTESTLLVLTEENKVFEFHTAKSSALLTPWSQRNSEFLPSEFLRLEQKPQGMFYHHRKLWVYGSQWLCFFDLKLDMSLRAGGKRKRAHDGLSIQDDSSKIEEELLNERFERAKEERAQFKDENKRRKPFWITQKYRLILKAVAWGNDIAVVEREAFALPTTTAFEASQMKI